jgi:hypothetical protein
LPRYLTFLIWVFLIRLMSLPAVPWIFVKILITMSKVIVRLLLFPLVAHLFVEDIWPNGEIMASDSLRLIYSLRHTVPPQEW